MIEVRDCINMETVTKNDLFVTLALGGAEARTTVKDEAGSKAEFNEAFQLYVVLFASLSRFAHFQIICCVMQCFKWW